MALSRGPYKVDEEISLRAIDRDSRSLVLRSPDGVVFPISTERGSATFRPPTPGIWWYEWGEGDTGTIEIVSADTEVPAPSFINRVEAG